MTAKKRGVSPVIATLLLIVIAVAAAVLAYIWITGYMGTLQAQAGAQQVQERIKIEGITIGTGADAHKITKIYIRNIGDVRVNVTTLYLANVSILASETVNQEIAPEGLLEFSTTSGGIKDITLKPGVTYTIKAVTSRGTEATYQFTYRP
jgi:flagellin-like protein